MQIFYEPANAKVGDVIPFYNEEKEKFDLFYLKNWNPDYLGEKDFGWHKLSTDDFINFTETSTHISGGTGSVLKIDNIYHMFYCTFEENPQRQFVRHAVSEDLETWSDIPEEKFTADDYIYQLSDWRDPYVFWNEAEQKWWMLVAAREKSNTSRNGCIGLCTSDDLKNWKYEMPIYNPEIHLAAYECPDMFRMNDWYYIVFSNYTDGFSTYYRKSKSPRGPWIRPEIDTFDSRAFYAAKTGTDGVKRYIFGWNPTRGENGWNFDSQKDYGKDFKTWNWGGTMVAHELVSSENGDLKCKPIKNVLDVYNQKEFIPLVALTGNWQTINEHKKYFVNSLNSMSTLISDKKIENDNYMISGTMKYSNKPKRFGLSFSLLEDFSEGYYFNFEPMHNKINFKSGLRMSEKGGQLFPYIVEQERDIILSEYGNIDYKFVVHDSMFILYINDEIAFSGRAYNRKNNFIGFFVEDGELEVANTYINTNN